MKQDALTVIECAPVAITRASERTHAVEGLEHHARAVVLLERSRPSIAATHEAAIVGQQ